MPALPTIIYEDESLIAFDKPSGLPVAPERRSREQDNLLAMVHEKMGAGLANVHRIDPETSGLVLFAKSKSALDFLSGQFQSKTVTKTYEALVVGQPVQDEFTVELVIKEDEARPGGMCVVKKHGKASVTDFTVRARFPQPSGRPGLAQLECRPHTGRPHQVRLHLATGGTPILNDPVYGNDTRLLLSDLKRGYKGRDGERPLITRLALHASMLTFTHPDSREKITVTAPLPKDFGVALKYLEKFARR